MRIDDNGNTGRPPRDGWYTIKTEYLGGTVNIKNEYIRLDGWQSFEAMEWLGPFDKEPEEPEP